MRKHILFDKLKEFDAMVKDERQKVNKRKRKPKENHHEELVISLTDATVTEAERKKARLFGQGSNKKQIEAILDYLKKGFSKCPACGGFQPELCLSYGDKTYTFTCTRITGEGKGVEETDFNKFSEWLQTHGYGVEFHDKLKAIAEAKKAEKKE